MNEDIQVLRTASCPTVTGSGRVDYSVGQDAKGNIHLAIVGNTNGGHYSSEWIAWVDILAALENVAPITALPLRELYAGRSVNSPGFLLAALVHLGLLVRLPHKTRHYALHDDYQHKTQKLQGKATPAKKAPPEKTPKVPAKKTAKALAKKATSRSVK